MGVAVNIITNRLVWVLIAACLLYSLAAQYLEGQTTLTIVNVLRFPAALWVALTFGFSVIGSIARGEKIFASHVMMTGVFTSWASDAAVRCYVSINRMLDYPAYMQNNPILGFFLFIGLVGCLMHVAVSNSVDDRMPDRWWNKVSGVIVLGVFILFNLYLWQAGAYEHLFQYMDMDIKTLSSGPQGGYIKDIWN